MPSIGANTMQCILGFHQTKEHHFREKVRFSEQESSSESVSFSELVIQKMI